MRLYEIDINSLWWFAADDEMEAMSMLRSELQNLETSEEELDDIMDSLIINELPQDVAETVSVIDSIDSAQDTLWDMFMSTHTPGLVYSDYHPLDEDDEESDDFGWCDEDFTPEDWL